MKKEYQALKIECITMTEQDVIRTSATEKDPFDIEILDWIEGTQD